MKLEMRNIFQHAQLLELAQEGLKMGLKAFISAKSPGVDGNVCGDRSGMTP